MEQERGTQLPYCRTLKLFFRKKHGQIIFNTCRCILKVKSPQEIKNI
jgi:hypothetical protein